ncbi:MAG: sulfite exporter TauE/SafE family protein [Bacteroidales bacterium]|nr:sulfite exporter TauE/SafE family protein [Bacteroidales bacterium]
MHPDFLKDIDIWSPEIIALLIGSGFLIGVVNTVAGSGTAIGYAVFMSLGLPPSWANGTVRIGVLPQTFAAGINFYKHKLLNLKNAVLIALPITLGSILGAEIAVNIDQEVFKKVIGIAMIFFLIIIFLKPEKWIRGSKTELNIKPKFWHYLLYFLIGTYGGFIHIGVGIFLLIALVMVSGYNLVHANSLKIFVVFIYTPFALAVFMINGEIYYAIGLISAIGNTLGGIVASKFAIKHGAKPLRWILMIVIIVFTGYLFGVHRVVLSLF